MAIQHTLIEMMSVRNEYVKHGMQRKQLLPITFAFAAASCRGSPGGATATQYCTDPPFITMKPQLQELKFTNGIDYTVSA